MKKAFKLVQDDDVKFLNGTWNAVTCFYDVSWKCDINSHLYFRYTFLFVINI